MLEFFGFLNCYKPANMTSRDLVNIATGSVKRVYRESRDLESDTSGATGKPPKVGHAGTLDPLAEGVLVLGIGPASRLTRFVQSAPKRYEAVFEMGASSVSGDLEEEVTRDSTSVIPRLGDLQAAANALTGWISQIPPAYSAVKVDGKRAYQLARKGVDVEMPSRRVCVHELTVTKLDHPYVTLDILCGSGTYVRTLGMDLAMQCGTTAVMTKLERTAIGAFESSDALTVDEIRNRSWVDRLRPAGDGLRHLPSIRLNSAQSWRLDNGLTVPVADTNPVEDADPTKGIVAYDPDGRVRAIVEVRGDCWAPTRVFHNAH
ncbi:MAG: tRNA pseudouridine(55) synthase TruB [Planctomycetota bacterium]